MHGPSLSAKQERSEYRLIADAVLRRSARVLATGLFVASVVSGFAQWTGSIAAADDGSGQAILKAIIENVRANEALYQNIDVSWMTKYNLERASEQPTKSLLRSSTTRGHLVQQQALFFVDATRESDANDGSRDKTRSSQEAFDGASTRILRDDAVGNVIEGRHESTLPIRPHTLILRNSFIRVPLSTYLEGAEACRAHPLGASFRGDWKDLTSTTEFLGSEQVGSRPCVHLRITTRLKRNGKVHVHGRHDLWLAVDRNYIPLKKINFAWRDPMGDLIGQVDEVTDFREIAPGIWYPTESVTTCPDDIVMAQEKKRVPGWREVCKIVNVKLNPKVDKAIFSSVKFPPSAVVYHVKNDQIVSTTYPTKRAIPTETPRLTKP